ncbi:hypothetical protein BDZ97DRAFT_1760939 [Flammula alnicola]|nr:hypothetical protein BDZ97DRAFT_1760939 [Flammula alnicola]
MLPQRSLTHVTLRCALVVDVRFRLQLPTAGFQTGIAIQSGGRANRARIQEVAEDESGKKIQRMVMSNSRSLIRLNGCDFHTFHFISLSTCDAQMTAEQSWVLVCQRLSNGVAQTSSLKNCHRGWKAQVDSDESYINFAKAAIQHGSNELVCEISNDEATQLYEAFGKLLKSKFANATRNMSSSASKTTKTPSSKSNFENTIRKKRKLVVSSSEDEEEIDELKDDHELNEELSKHWSESSARTPTEGSTSKGLSLGKKTSPKKQVIDNTNRKKRMRLLEELESTPAQRRDDQVESEKVIASGGNTSLDLHQTRPAEKARRRPSDDEMRDDQKHREGGLESLIPVDGGSTNRPTASELKATPRPPDFLSRGLQDVGNPPPPPIAASSTFNDSFPSSLRPPSPVTAALDLLANTAGTLETVFLLLQNDQNHRDEQAYRQRKARHGLAMAFKLANEDAHKAEEALEALDISDRPGWPRMGQDGAMSSEDSAQLDYLRVAWPKVLQNLTARSENRLRHAQEELDLVEEFQYASIESLFGKKF